MRVFLLPLIAVTLAAPGAFAGACKDTAGTTEFKSSDSVWWGNVERAHTPYLEFAKTELAEPAPAPDAVYTVAFTMKKAELSSAAIATLNEVFAHLDTDDALRARVEYPSGGRRNADAVKGWLVSQGIDGDRIEAAGSGGQAGPMAMVRIRLVE